MQQEQLQQLFGGGEAADEAPAQEVQSGGAPASTLSSGGRQRETSGARGDQRETSRRPAGDERETSGAGEGVDGPAEHHAAARKRVFDLTLNSEQIESVSTLHPRERVPVTLTLTLTLTLTFTLTLTGRADARRVGGTVDRVGPPTLNANP